MLFKLEKYTTYNVKWACKNYKYVALLIEDKLLLSVQHYHVEHENPTEIVLLLPHGGLYLYKGPKYVI